MCQNQKREYAWPKRKRRCIKSIFALILILTMTQWPAIAQTARCTEPAEPVLSERERQLIIHAVAAECPHASYGVQVGLASVILHRLESGRYGKDAACVVYAAGFLQCTVSGCIAGFLPEDIRKQAECAVNTALQGGDPTNGALYFASPENHQTPPTHITYREGGYIFGKR